MYIYQGFQVPFMDYLGCVIVTTPSLTRTLSRVKVGLMGRHYVTLSYNLSVTTAQNLPPWSA